MEWSTRIEVKEEDRKEMKKLFMYFNSKTGFNEM